MTPLSTHFDHDVFNVGSDAFLWLGGRRRDSSVFMFFWVFSTWTEIFERKVWSEQLSNTECVCQQACILTTTILWFHKSLWIMKSSAKQLQLEILTVCSFYETRQEPTWKQIFNKLTPIGFFVFPLFHSGVRWHFTKRAVSTQLSLKSLVDCAVCHQHFCTH